MLSKSSEGVSVEPHGAVQQVSLNTGLVSSCLTWSEPRGLHRCKGQQCLSRELKAKSHCWHPEPKCSGYEAAVPNVLGEVGITPLSLTTPAPVASYPVMQHPFGGSHPGKKKSAA